MMLTVWLTYVGQVASGPAAGVFWDNFAFPDIIHATVRDDTGRR